MPAQLYSGVRLGRVEDDATAAVKGRIEMAAVLAKAIQDRQIRPTRDLEAWYGSDQVTLPVARLNECFERAQRSPTHNEGADRFRVEVIEALAEQVYNRSFDNYADAYRSFGRSSSLKVFLLRHWPTLTPEQALNDLLGSRALLRKACVGSGLSLDEVRLLDRERVPELELDDARWSDADIPLLDELWSLVGGLPTSMAEEDRQRVRDARDEFEIAAAQDRLDEADDDLELETDDGDPATPKVQVIPAPPIRADRV